MPVCRPPEEESRPLDLPRREHFAQPVRGQATPQPRPSRVVLDDSLPWEEERGEEDDPNSE